MYGTLSRARLDRSNAINAATEFYRSQLGDVSVINYGYTDFPWKLLLKDIYYFFVYSCALPWVMLPLSPWNSGDLDELYPSARNLFCISIHFILIILQLAFIVGLFASVLFPVWMVALFVGGFLLLNWAFCLMLNGKGITFHSDEKYAQAKPEHEHEQWIFLNGVAVG